MVSSKIHSFQTDSGIFVPKLGLTFLDRGRYSFGDLLGWLEPKSYYTEEFNRNSPLLDLLLLYITLVAVTNPTTSQ
jgi:hypothetical protein